MTNDDIEQTRRAGSVLASVFVLLALLGIYGMLARTPDNSVDLEKVLGNLEWTSSPSHGMEELTRRKLGDGRLVALFGDPDDLPAEKEMGEGGMGMGKGMGGGGPRGGGSRGRRGMGGMGGMSMGKPDPNSLWPKVPDGVSGQAPWQAALVHYPSSEKAESTLSKEFGRLDFKDLSTLPKSGGSAVVDSGHVLWHGYRLPFVRTRHFRMENNEPVFHDSMRINLTMDRHSLVLYLRWRPGQLGEADGARPWLDSLTVKVAE
ncbi:MAG: hypothetical protein P1V35_13370 [Planctomycetota bacterium]|nr:hypothetical protein [Planctomycetota bacterium]